jgi:hypothetical protein
MERAGTEKRQGRNGRKQQKTTPRTWSAAGESNMRRSVLSGIVATAAALVVLAVLAAPSQAQYYRSVRVAPAFGQASWVTPYLQLQQQAYANAVLGQSLYYTPPWVYGYNPYPRVVNSYGYPYPSYPPGYYSYGGYYSAPYTASYVTPYLYGAGFP